MTVLTDDNLNQLLPLTDWWNDRHYKESTQRVLTPSSRWDGFFMNLAEEVASLSKCASRKIGAILVKDHRVISMGFNGSPAKSKLCQSDISCPRKKMGFKSGQATDLCPAVHAEVNCITNAARNGISTLGSTMYMSCCLPCKNCAGAIINAGITHIYIIEGPDYDKLARELFKDAGVKIMVWKCQE